MERLQSVKELLEDKDNQNWFTEWQPKKPGLVSTIAEGYIKVQEAYQGASWFEIVYIIIMASLFIIFGAGLMKSNIQPQLLEIRRPR